MVGGGGGGGQQRWFLTSKNRPSHHKYKSQNSLRRKTAERLEEHLMPAGRYLFIPFLRTKIQKCQTKNRSSEKSHKKD